jgi:hypothetical protein
MEADPVSASMIMNLIGGSDSRSLKKISSQPKITGNKKKAKLKRSRSKSKAGRRIARGSLEIR